MRLRHNFSILFVCFLSCSYLFLVARDSLARTEVPETSSAWSPHEAESIPECSWELALSSTFVRLFPDYRLKTSNSDRLLFSSEQAYAPTISLNIARSKSVNAWAVAYEHEDSSTAQISLSSTLLELVKSKSELAFILAHEASHVFARHKAFPIKLLLLSQKQKKRIAEVQKSWEFHADARAGQYLINAGFEVGSIPLLLRRIEKAQVEVADSGHPSISDRIEAIRRIPSPIASATAKITELLAYSDCDTCQKSTNFSEAGAMTQ